ncbi:MAG: putative transport system ATP-binding protein [Herbinix sp.]|jgi:putative ABC transport system ATP-binding protein|nr:putative transport system ATP-binding protein [Herbinix sp.]
MVILQTADLNKIYQQNQKTIYAIIDCNVNIKRGDFLAITGGKGSGKSTLLRLLGGLEYPSGGKVYYNHNDLYSMEEHELTSLCRKEISFVARENQMISGLNLYDNIILPSLLHRSNLNKEYLKELTDSLHITDVLHHYPKYIPNGKKRCAAFVRALLKQPEIIFVDEAEKDLDHQLGKDILDVLLNYINWYQKTLVMVTNDPEVTIFADHIIRLDMGKVEENRKIYGYQSTFIN